MLWARQFTAFDFNNALGEYIVIKLTLISSLQSSATTLNYVRIKRTPRPGRIQSSTPVDFPSNVQN